MIIVSYISTKLQKIKLEFGKQSKSGLTKSYVHIKGKQYSELKTDMAFLPVIFPAV